mmetsp:Transcript_45835/g.113916  ORF Transcript_45835/g.113916 Transcript_45835/m.113916 type:complete len:201 (-) Transcript_45835:515-1117(-)
MALATSSVMRTAPIGKPPANGLARVMMSGDTPACWCPHSFPVRPRPHCTSSNTSTAPLLSQSSRRPFRNPTSAGFTPPSPCTGSTNTAHVSPSIARLASFRSFHGQNVTSPPIRGAKGSRIFFFDVTVRAPIVRPWKDFSKATKLTFFALPSRPFLALLRASLRANLMAASLASVPLLQKKTLLAKGASCTSFLARSICG